MPDDASYVEPKGTPPKSARRQEEAKTQIATRTGLPIRKSAPRHWRVKKVRVRALKEKARAKPKMPLQKRLALQQRALSLIPFLLVQLD